MFEDLGPLRDSIRDVILTSDVDLGMIRLTFYDYKYQLKIYSIQIRVFQIFHGKVFILNTKYFE